MLAIEQTREFRQWFTGLQDPRGVIAIARQIDRMSAAGHYIGDWKNVGGPIEVRIRGRGPGYRLYLSIERKVLLLLLVGGDKSSQSDDVAKAKRLLVDWRKQHGD